MMGPLRKRLARKRDLRRIADSGFFNDAYYRRENPEVDFSWITPLEHFYRFGGEEGRNPSERFDVVWYLGEYGDRIWDDRHPLLHYLEQDASAGVTPLPLNDLQRFESFDRALRSGILQKPRLAKAVKRVHLNLTSGTTAASDGGLPLPPLDLARRIGAGSLEAYESVGAAIKAELDRHLAGRVDAEGARWLDFGCGAGRVIRQFDAEAARGEVWGCDIDSTSIMWCMEHLAPPFRFFQLSDAPVLPLESNSFDVVYAIAVFSQVFRDWSMWAMEIRRILKPGGVFLMTYNGPGVFESVFGLGSFDAYMKDTGLLVWGPYNPWNQGGPHTAISADWIAKMWGSMFDVDYVAVDGLMDYQSLALMRKPLAPGGLRSAPAVHRFGTSQVHSDAATGAIDARYDASRPFLESYGLESGPDLVVTGWIVFRGDEPQAATVRIDDAVLAADVTFRKSGAYADWGAASHGFGIAIDAASIAPGRHALTLDVVSRGGARHALSMPLLLRTPDERS